MKNYLQLNFSLLYWIFVAPFTGQFFKIAPIFRQMVFIGVRAAPMVALTAFSVGVTLAMQAAHSLETLGAEMYIPDLVMLTLLREMGPVLIAVIVIGRSGSAVAAEIGTMKVSEEIEALEVMAINPVQFLVVPRFLAMMVMLPALTIFGNYIGILGGWAVCVFALDFNTAGYILRALESAETLGFVFGNDQERSLRLAHHHDLVQRGANCRRWRRRRRAGYHDSSGAIFARNVNHERGAHGRFLFRRMKANDKPMIEVDRLVRKFGDRTVLNDISFNVHRRDTLVIMGGSGCGKSTLLRHMIGSMQPTSGTVKLFGEEVTGMKEREILRIRLRFGMLFQSGALLASLTVGENVALPLLQHTDKSVDEIEEIVEQKLQMVGLTGFEDLRPDEISGGMKKRVGLARALALDPELLFSDEPTSGLDPIMTAVVDELTMKLTRGKGMTAVVVSHDMTSAFRIATRMIMLGHGGIVAQGTPDEIRASSNPEVQQFINGEPDGPIPLNLSQEEHEHHQQVKPRPFARARGRFHRKTG